MSLEQIDLAVQQRVHLRLRIGDPDPFDAVDLGDLAAGEARGRLVARLVARVPEVDRLVAGLPLVALEDEGTGAGRVRDLLLRIGLGDALGHHEGQDCRRSCRAIRSPARSARVNTRRKLLSSTAVSSLTKDSSVWPVGIARAPAPDRGDAVLGLDRRAVVPFEAVAQREGPGELVVRDGPTCRPSAAWSRASRRARRACRRPGSRGARR